MIVTDRWTGKKIDVGSSGFEIRSGVDRYKKPCAFILFQRVPNRKMRAIIVCKETKEELQV